MHSAFALLLPLLLPACGPADDLARHDPNGDPRPGETGDEPSDPPEPWSFVVFADNQFATESCTSGVDERLAVPEVVRDLAPDLVLHAGDLMDHAYDDGAYEQFRSCYADMLAELPFFPTPGNHDMGYDGIANYEAFLEDQLFNWNPARWPGDPLVVAWEDDPNSYSEDFDDPSGTDNVPSGVSFETFYAFKVNNAYVVSFEQGTRWWSNTPREWLESHLQAARSDPSVDHIIVIMHHPMYSTTMADDSDSECIGPVRGYYEEIFQAWGVTLVFAGHAHVYEHFYVPDDGTPTRADPAPSAYPGSQDAVHYVVTGGGGGPLPSCDPMSSPLQETSYPFLQDRGCGYHVQHVQVEGRKITVRVVGVEGDESSQTTSVWDEYVIE